MKRVAFILKVKEERIEEYKEYHRNVWPEVNDALRRNGWRNYTLFMRQDGMLFGYYNNTISPRLLFYFNGWVHVLPEYDPRNRSGAS